MGRLVSLDAHAGAVPVADMLERLAAEIRAGRVVAHKAALVLALHDDDITLATVRTQEEAVGLLELGKLQVAMGEDTG